MHLTPVIYERNEVRIFRYSVVVMALTVITLSSGCGTARAYSDAKEEGNDKGFVGWLFTPRTEMTDEELDRAESIRDGGRVSTRGRFSYGAGGGSRFRERYSISRRDGEVRRSYSYRYDAAVGGGVDIRFKYSPRPREYSYDKEQRKRIEERRERSRRRD